MEGFRGGQEFVAQNPFKTISPLWNVKKSWPPIGAKLQRSGPSVTQTCASWARNRAGQSTHVKVVKTGDRESIIPAFVKNSDSPHRGNILLRHMTMPTFMWADSRCGGRCQPAKARNRLNGSFTGQNFSRKLHFDSQHFQGSQFHGSEFL